MDFNLANAVPVDETPTGTTAVGTFNLANSMPIDDSKGIETPHETFKKYKQDEKSKEVGQHPDEGFLNATVHSAGKAAWDLIVKPMMGVAKQSGIDTKQLGFQDPAEVDKFYKDMEDKHPIAAVIGGSVPYIATAPLLPEALLPKMWMRFGAQAGAIGGLSAAGNVLLEDSLRTPADKVKDVAIASGEGAAMGAVMGGAQSINILKRPFASVLARAGATFSGTTVLSTFFGQNITEAMKQGGILTAVGLIAETPSLARTVLGRGSIAKTNETLKEKGLPEVNPDASPEIVQKQIDEALPELAKIAELDKPQVLSATVKLKDGREFDGASHEDALNKAGMSKVTPEQQDVLKKMFTDKVFNDDFNIEQYRNNFSPEAFSKLETLFNNLGLNKDLVGEARSQVPFDKVFDLYSRKDINRMVDATSDAMSGGHWDFGTGEFITSRQDGFKMIDPSDGKVKFIDRAKAKEIFGKDHSHEFDGLNESKFLTPPEEPKIVNPEILAKQKESGNQGQMDIRMIPGVEPLADEIVKAHTELQKALSPYNIEGGKFTAAELRENLGKFARSQDIFEASTHKAKKFFDKANIPSSLDFMYRMDEGKPQESDGLTSIASVLDERLVSKRKEVQALGTGRLEQFYEHYFPRIYEDPKKAENFIKSFFTRKPFEGKKNFLKKRTFPTMKEAIESGLKPITYNPVDMVMLRLREMDKYLAAHRTIGAMKEQGLMKFVKVGGERPDGWVKIDDKIAQVTSKLETGELVIRGSWWSQPDSARIINNYLSPGLRGNYLYDVYRGAGNTMNQFQLGLSAFHLGFTSMDATISKFALGINKFSAGDISGAAKEFAKSPFAPITNAIEGDKLMKAWDGHSPDPLHTAIADAMATAGGRAKMDKFYATTAGDSITKSLKEGKYVSAILKTPLHLIEQASKPIMEYIVPRQKLGVFSDLMKFELECNPNMSHEQLRDVAQKAWDSVDNRMGQMVYDNLFWNRTIKDIGMASVRSLGWNLGTIREIGGGVADIKGLATGKGMSYRTSYILALPAISALYGATYQYLATGQGPQELRDYFFPKTGGIDKKGMPARISLPTYMKDIYHYSKNPVGTISNKFSPVNSMVVQMLQNKDFYGTKIHNEDDPLISQALQEMEYVAGQFMPFGIKNQQKDTRKSLQSTVEPFIGIVPAPYDVSFTPAEMRAHELAIAKSQGITRTKEQADKSKATADVRNEYFKTGDDAALDQAIDDGKITQKDKNEIIKEKDMTNLERLTRHLSYDEVLSVYTKASDAEKEQLQAILEKKKSSKVKAHSWTDKQEELYQEMFSNE